MRIISLFIIVVIVCCKQPATHQIDTVKNDKEAKTEHRLKRDTILTHHKTTILSHFKNLIEQSHFNGHILVAKGNTIIIDTTTGYSNIGKRIPLEHNNAIQLASITKPITARSYCN
jgi:CubicO group peptidase (beta-lactamase class C family)|tara:strand:+ start:1404 stop:1751 length:348 start_codon:yes stop_codon:yes gene_type:complete